MIDKIKNFINNFQIHKNSHKIKESFYHIKNITHFCKTYNLDEKYENIINQIVCNDALFYEAIREYNFKGNINN